MTFWKRFSILFVRGLLLRCPVCGEGKLFCGVFKMYDNCPVCGFHFEREPGYFTGAIAVNLVVAELIIAAVTLPLAIDQSIPFIPFILWGMTMPFLLPLIFFRHAKSFWMTIEHLFHPVTDERVFFPK